VVFNKGTKFNTPTRELRSHSAACPPETAKIQSNSSPTPPISIDFKKQKLSWVLVAQAYNPSYSGGRDQEDYGSKPALGK
jgi:hypothetical protein